MRKEWPENILEEILESNQDWLATWSASVMNRGSKIEIFKLGYDVLRFVRTELCVFRGIGLPAWLVLIVL